MTDFVRARLLFVLWLSFLLSQCVLGVGMVTHLPDAGQGWDLVLLDDFVVLILSTGAITTLAAGVSMSRWKFRSAQTRALTQWASLDACGVIGSLLAILRQDAALGLPFIILSAAALIKHRPELGVFLLERGKE